MRHRSQLMDFLIHTVSHCGLSAWAPVRVGQVNLLSPRLELQEGDTMKMSSNACALQYLLKTWHRCLETLSHGAEDSMATLCLENRMVGKD